MKQFYILFYLFVSLLPFIGNAQEIVTPEGKIQATHKEVILNLEDYVGDIQWEFSADGVEWHEMPDADSDSVTVSANLRQFYRAKVTVNDCDPYYSDVTSIIPASEKITVKFPGGEGIPGKRYFLESADQAIGFSANDTLSSTRYLLDDEYASIYWVTDEDDIYMMAHFYSDLNEVKEVNSTTTAISMILMNPVFAPLDQVMRRRIIESVHTLPHFDNLVTEIEKLISQGIGIFDERSIHLLEIMDSIPVEDLFNEPGLRSASADNTLNEGLNGALPDYFDIVNAGRKLTFENRNTISFEVGIYDDMHFEKLVHKFVLSGESYTESLLGKVIGKGKQEMDIDHLETGKYRIIVTNGFVSPYESLGSDARTRNLINAGSILLESLISSILSDVINDLFEGQCLQSFVGNMALHEATGFDHVDAISAGVENLLKCSLDKYKSILVQTTNSYFIEKYQFRVEKIEKILKIFAFYNQAELTLFLIKLGFNQHFFATCRMVDFDMKYMDCFQVEAKQQLMTSELCDSVLVEASLIPDKFYFDHEGYNPSEYANRYVWFMAEGEDPKFAVSDGWGNVSVMMKAPDRPGEKRVDIQVLWQGVGVVSEDHTTIRTLDPPGPLLVYGDKQKGTKGEALANKIGVSPPLINALEFLKRNIIYEWKVIKGEGTLESASQDGAPVDYAQYWTLGEDGDEQVVQVRIYDPDCLNWLDTTILFTASTAKFSMNGKWEAVEHNFMPIGQIYEETHSSWQTGDISFFNNKTIRNNFTYFNFDIQETEFIFRVREYYERLTRWYDWVCSGGSCSWVKTDEEHYINDEPVNARGPLQWQNDSVMTVRINQICWETIGECENEQLDPWYMSYRKIDENTILLVMFIDTDGEEEWNTEAFNYVFNMTADEFKNEYDYPHEAEFWRLIMKRNTGE